MGFLDSLIQRYRNDSPSMNSTDLEIFETQCDAACNAAIDFVAVHFDTIADIIDDNMEKYDDFAEWVADATKDNIWPLHVWKNQVKIMAYFNSYSPTISRGAFQFDEDFFKSCSITFHVVAYDSSGAEGLSLQTQFGSDVIKDFQYRTGENMFQILIDTMEAYEEQTGKIWDDSEEYREIPMIYMEAIFAAIADYMSECGYEVEIGEPYLNEYSLIGKW